MDEAEIKSILKLPNIAIIAASNSNKIILL
jgi:hypothetical protein